MLRSTVATTKVSSHGFRGWSWSVSVSTLVKGPQGNVANRRRHYKILKGAAEIKAECRQVENAIKIVRTIQIAMLLSVALFVLVGELVGRIPKLNDPTPFHALSLATITIVGVIVVVRRTLVLQSAAILANRPNDAATLNRWRAGYLMTYALSEAIALFGLSLRMIGFSLSQVASFYIAGFILLLFFSPRRPVVQTT